MIARGWGGDGGMRGCDGPFGEDVHLLLDIHRFDHVKIIEGRLNI
jgi:hypothetical protein